MTEKPVRILFVEDTPSDIELAERVLRKEGLAFTWMRVEREPDFLRAIREFRPDIIVSDYGMPEFDGMRALKLAQVHWIEVPFILFTGSINEETAVECMKAGATDYILKEQIARLPFAVREAIDKARDHAAREASEHRYRTLVDNSIDAIFLIQDHEIRFQNPISEKLFGVPVGSLIDPLIHPDDRTASLERRRRRLAGEPVATFNSFRIVTSSGKQHWLEVNSVVIEWEGHPAILNSARDVTEQKLLSDQLTQAQKMEAIGTLAGGIAHDFNNILGVIVGNAELLAITQAVSPEGADHVRNIQAAAVRAKQLVRQILAFSRQARQEKILIDLKAIVKETLEFLRASLPATIQVRQYIQPDSGTVMADATQVQQVLMNLCTNAAHAMEAQGGALRITLANETVPGSEPRAGSGPAPGDYVRIEVADSGCGMEASMLERIFDPFFTTKEPGKGTGLGLSVVHGIVEAHGGAITVASEPGKGTTFTVYLPRAEGAETPLTEEAQPLPRGNERVLLVDDEQPLIEIVAQMLRMLGYRVEGKDSALDAVETFRADPQRYDLVITDMTMPQLTGLALARTLREIRPTLPIILCTGFSDQVGPDSLSAAGVRELLLKPVVLRELAAAVRRVLA